MLSSADESLKDKNEKKTVRDGMFGPGIAQKDILDLYLGNVVMVATDLCGKSPPRESGYIGLRENIHF